MHKMKWVLVLWIGALLSACSHLPDGNRVSTPSSDNGSIANLRTPAGSAIHYDTLYPIPQRNYANKNTTVDITPPTLDPSTAASGSGWFSWY